MPIRRTKRTRVSVETREFIVLHGQANRVRGYCPQCRQQGWWVTAGQAAQMAGVTTRTVYRWVEEGQVHFEEWEGREIRVCANSLSLRRNDESRRES